MHNKQLNPCRLVWLALLGLALSGCGFQLRGQAPALPAALSPLAITGIDADTPLYIALQQRLETGGNPLVADPARAAAVLIISDRQSRSELLTIDSSNKASEYELVELLSFQIRKGDRESTPERLSASRIHYAPGGAVLARNREAEILRQTLREELAERLLHRLAAWR